MSVTGPSSSADAKVMTPFWRVGSPSAGDSHHQSLNSTSLLLAPFSTLFPVIVDVRDSACLFCTPGRRLPNLVIQLPRYIAASRLDGEFNVVA